MILIQLCLELISTLCPGALSSLRIPTTSIDYDYNKKTKQDPFNFETDTTLIVQKNNNSNNYKDLENQVISSDNNISGAEKAKCAEVAANIAIDVLKMESEGIKAFKQGHVLMAEAAAATAKTARTLSTSTVSDSYMMEELGNSC